MISFHVTVANYEYLLYWPVLPGREHRVLGPRDRDPGHLAHRRAGQPAPSAAFPPLLDPASPAFKRAEVIGHTLWVTPYREDERWPCGDFPNLSEHDALGSASTGS
jgi:Cu2+-containing amine oxidase